MSYFVYLAKQFISLYITFSPLSEWSVTEVKDWALRTFGSETVAEKFEQEEIDGRILLSTTVQSSQAMEKLGLNTIGKKGKFLEKINELGAGPSAGIHLHSSKCLTFNIDGLRSSCVASLSGCIYAS